MGLPPSVKRLRRCFAIIKHYYLLYKNAYPKVNYFKLKVYYFDSFGVETPPLFLEEYVDLGSNERIQEYNKSYCGAYCLYKIQLIERPFTIEGALDILVNQVKCPDGYKKCQCLGCKVGVEGNQGTCRARSQMVMTMTIRETALQMTKKNPPYQKMT